VDLAKKARWVRGLDDPGRGEDATRLEWDRAEKLAPNKETVEVGGSETFFEISSFEPLGPSLGRS
jgi:hypothetical protein